MFSKNLQNSRFLLGVRSRLGANTHNAMMAAACQNMPARGFSADNFLSGANANYIDYMYAQWQEDPSSVHASWNAYFSGGDASFSTPPTLGQQAGGMAGMSDIAQIVAALQASGAGAGGADQSRNADELVRL